MPVDRSPGKGENGDGEPPNLHVVGFFRGQVVPSRIELYSVAGDVYQLKDGDYRGTDAGPLATALHHDDLGRSGPREIEPKELVLFSVPFPGAGDIRISTEGDRPEDSVQVSTNALGGPITAASAGREHLLTSRDTLAVNLIDISEVPGYLSYIPHLDPYTLLSDAPGPLRSYESPRGPRYVGGIPIGASVGVREPVALYINTGQVPTRIEVVPNRR